MPHSFGGSVTVTRAELPVCGVHSDWAAAVWGVLDDIVELFDECAVPCECAVGC